MVYRGVLDEEYANLDFWSKWPQKILSIRYHERRKVEANSDSRKRVQEQEVSSNKMSYVPLHQKPFQTIS